VILQEQSEKRVVVVVDEHALKIVLLLHLYQLVDVLLHRLDLSQSQVVSRQSICGLGYFRWMCR
jgi:hypothetical protein